MRLLISIIDWEYPSSKAKTHPMEWNLQDQEILQNLILAYGNGIILELRAEGKNADAIDLLRGIAIGTGHSSQVELFLEEKQRLWLYQEGDEGHQQPIESGGYTFINPIPQPAMFSKNA